MWKNYEYKNGIELVFYCLGMEGFKENLDNLYIKFVIKSEGINVICKKKYVRFIIFLIFDVKKRI